MEHLPLLPSRVERFKKSRWDWGEGVGTRKRLLPFTPCQAEACFPYASVEGWVSEGPRVRVQAQFKRPWQRGGWGSAWVTAEPSCQALRTLTHGLSPNENGGS